MAERRLQLRCETCGIIGQVATVGWDGDDSPMDAAIRWAEVHRRCDHLVTIEVIAAYERDKEGRWPATIVTDAEEG